MSDLSNKLSKIDTNKLNDKKSIINFIELAMKSYNYKLVEANYEKPWGVCLRFDYCDAEKFIKEFFSNLSLIDIKLGIDDMKLSPKILVISPGARLSWQYHNYRAECWKFLTDGGSYIKSNNNNENQAKVTKSGDFVQLNAHERHRLIGNRDKYVIVAEIWQHTNPDHLSSEDDIIRLKDDYRR